MKDIVIFGAQEFAEIAHYYFTHDSDRRVVAFTVDGDYMDAPLFEGLPVVPFEEVAERYPPSRNGMFVAIGYERVNRLRAAKSPVYETARRSVLRRATAICRRRVSHSLRLESTGRSFADYG